MVLGLYRNRVLPSTLAKWPWHIRKFMLVLITKPNTCETRQDYLDTEDDTFKMYMSVI